MNFPTSDAILNPRVIAAIGRVLIGQGFKQHGDWLHGSCIHPERHQNGDRNPSFGFNTQTGYGHCYVCGTLLAKEVCDVLDIDPNQLGGLVEQPQPPVIKPQPDVRRKPAPDKPNDPPPSVPTDYKLPDWLEHYMEWAGTTGNQTPMIFHQAAGLWPLATAVGRRIYGEAPWGVKIYPNLYLMLVAGTTFYRKSTAYKLAEQVARAAIPHKRLPAPQTTEMGLTAQGALRLKVACWEQCQQYGDWLRRRCDPGQETELDDRLKGFYGRMHVQAFKLAALFAALDWLKTSDEAPTVTVGHWNAAQILAEGWRGSAHRLLEQLDRSGEATIERRQQERMLSSIRAKGQQGIELRDLYRQMHVTAKVGRQVAQELVKAGLVVEARINGAQAYTAIEYLSAV